MNSTHTELSSNPAGRLTGGTFKRSLKLLAWLVLLLFLLFILPGLVSLGVWASSDYPRSWRSADWSSAGVLNPNPPREEAQVLLMSARTGGLKGALATHSWLVLKKPGERNYIRYDVVGWGHPVRRNSYAADGRWYSNEPEIVDAISGDLAARLIPEIENQIQNYRWSNRGDYGIWPGPNSNTFVAQILRRVPELGMVMPATAVGRDFPLNAAYDAEIGDEWRFSLGGYAGFVWSKASGIEFNFLGLVSGVDWRRGVVKIPGFGEFEVAGFTSVDTPSDDVAPKA